MFRKDWTIRAGFWQWDLFSPILHCCAGKINAIRYLKSIYNNYLNKTGFSFSFSVKAAALKQQISKFYPHIISTEASYQKKNIFQAAYPHILLNAN